MKANNTMTDDELNKLKSTMEGWQQEVELRRAELTRLVEGVQRAQARYADAIAEYKAALWKEATRP